MDRYPKEGLSKEIIDEFVKNHKIDYAKIKTCADVLVGQIAYVFDINYLYSLEKINNEKYLDKLIEKFDAKDEKTLKILDEFKNIAKKYMQDKIKEGIICLKNY